MKNKQVVPLEDLDHLMLVRHVEKKFPHLLGDVDKHANTSMYYGFTPIKTPALSKEDTAKAEQLSSKTISSTLDEKRPGWRAPERIAMLRTYAENEMHVLPQPIQVYYKKPFPGSGERRQSGEVQFGLDIFGAAQPTCEALVIQTAMAVLRDEGFENLIVELNSVGDRDAMAKHERELCNYYKKHAASLPPQFRTAFRANIFDILTTNDPGCEIFRESAPKSVSYLGEAGRKHFMEVLNYLETLDIPYRINHGLLGNRDLSTHAIFEIKHAGPEKEITLAVGSRYNALSRKLGFKKELPAVGVSIHFKKQSQNETFKTITNPKFYFIQFGNDARLRSMRLIEMLRKERISVYHALTHDKLLPQMTAAENLKVPYVLIMGQKEALEGSVVVRNVSTRAQETVDVCSLVSYLKKLK